MYNETRNSSIKGRAKRIDGKFLTPKIGIARFRFQNEWNKARGRKENACALFVRMLVVRLAGVDYLAPLLKKHPSFINFVRYSTA